MIVLVSLAEILWSVQVDAAPAVDDYGGMLSLGTPDPYNELEANLPNLCPRRRHYLY